MDKKYDYRSECLEVLGLPEGTPDTVILKNLQVQMGKWHPDKNNFTDVETSHQAEERYKKLNELRQGLKIQNEREKIENGIVAYTEDSSKEENEFASIYEVLDLKVQLYDANAQIEQLKNSYDSVTNQNETLRKQLAVKSHTEIKDKIDDLKHVYKPKSLYRNISFGSFLLALTSQVGVIRQFLVDSLGLSNVFVLGCTIFITILFFLKYQHNMLVFRLIEELIGYFTNPKTIRELDKSKYLRLKFVTKIHVFEETDFFDAVDKKINASRLTKILFWGYIETVKRQIVDAVITDLLSKKIVSISYVYEGVRTFKIEESDFVTYMSDTESSSSKS